MSHFLGDSYFFCCPAGTDQSDADPASSVGYLSLPS